MLSKSHIIPSYLQLNNGIYTYSSKDSNDALLDTHFPGSIEFVDQTIATTNSLVDKSSDEFSFIDGFFFHLDCIR